MYHIQVVRLNEKGIHALFLVPESNHEFWSDWVKKKSTKQVALGFASLITRIQAYGVAWAVKTNKLKTIDGNLGVVELKNFEGVWRALCYLQNENQQNRLVMLKEFRGHQGSDTIPPDILEQCRKLSEVARKLMMEERNNEDNV